MRRSRFTEEKIIAVLKEKARSQLERLDVGCTFLPLALGTYTEAEQIV
jgi:hypothetical protein